MIMNMHITKSLPALLLFLSLTVLASLTFATDQPMLKAITFAKADQHREEITFDLNGTYIPKTFAIKGKKPRVVFDFYGVGQALTLPNTITVGGKYVERIRIGRHGGASPKTRVVLDLVPGKKIRFSQNFNRENNTLTIVLLPDSPQEEPALAESVAGDKKQPTIPEEPRKPTQTSTKTQQKKSVGQQKTQPLTKAGKQESPVVHQKEVAAGEQKTSRNLPDTNRNEITRSEATSSPKTPTLSSFPDSKGLKTAVLESVVFDNSSNRGEMIQFTLTDFHPPKVFGIEEGVPRVVCDFTSTKAGKKLATNMKTNGRWVKAIRIGSHQNPDRVRVVIDLAPNNNYDLQQVFFKEENLFVIIVNTVAPLPSSTPEEKSGMQK